MYDIAQLIYTSVPDGRGVPPYKLPLKLSAKCTCGMFRSSSRGNDIPRCSRSLNLIEAVLPEYFSQFLLTISLARHILPVLVQVSVHISRITCRQRLVHVPD